MDMSTGWRRIGIGAVFLGLSGVAAAQWVFLARQAIGRVEQMQQSSPQAAGGAGASHDVASVINEVPPAKVFDAVKSMLGKNTKCASPRPTKPAVRWSSPTGGRSAASRSARSATAWRS